VLELQAKGFTQVACLLGGLDAWTKDGGKLVTAQP
jgi:rhodanese-related sulfurtransferase